MVGRRFAQLLMLLDGAVEMMSVSALCAHSFGLFHSASGEQRCISRFSLFEAKLLPLALTLRAPFADQFPNTVLNGTPLSSTLSPFKHRRVSGAIVT